MLQILPALIYISLLCWTWGYLLLQFFLFAGSDQEEELYHFPLTCFAGMGVVAAVAGCVSLWLPLGNIAAQLIVLSPALLAWMNKPLRTRFMLECRRLKKNYTVATFILLLSLIAMVLVMSPYTIYHPDTVGYHAQTIKWIEAHKAIPGLVHLETRYGYQGLWYCLCALFSFPFTGSSALTFINIAVICWFMLFLVQKINQFFFAAEQQRHIITGLLFCLLLVFTLWNYGQVRLTLSSASADFIAAIFVWLVFYLLFISTGSNTRLQSLLLIIFLGTVAITIKLSTAPVAVIMLFAISVIIKIKKYKAFLVSCLVSLIVLVPFVGRNLVTSGYAAFPAALIDVADFDWKLDKEATVLEKKYITAYARVGAVTEKEDIESAAAMSLNEWMPAWWKNLSAADRFALMLLVTLLLFSVLIFKWISASRQTVAIITTFVSSLAGLLFWFTQAPDPRFGYGFIIPVQGIILYYLANRFVGNTNLLRRFFPYALYMLSFGIGVYTIYRLTYYFTVSGLISPSGLVKIPYHVIECGGLPFNRATDITGCGSTPTPCVENNCNGFELRTGNLEDGFRAAQPGVN